MNLFSINFPILSLITFVPLIGAVILLFINKENGALIKWISAVISGIVLILSIILYLAFNPALSSMQFREVYSWIPSLDVKYFMGIDGLSLPFIILTAVLTFLSVIYSWIINERPKEYFILFLLLEVGMLGVFTSLDFVLFYMFWEISLVPMYFLIGVWGGARREYAAIKFFLYTLVGSLAMLLSILILFFNAGTFDMLEIASKLPFATDIVKSGIVFLGFFLAFAIKVPMFPFHTWLPDAHVEAPTAGSVILAGILLKMGTYGFLRVLMPILPEACSRYAFIIAILALISIIYGALVSMAQTDLKKLIAYSSVNHMGYVMLGTAAAMAASTASLQVKTTALGGAVLQMITHGIITGGLFFLVGVIYERTHTRDLKNFGGLGVKIPIYTGIMSATCFASLGLPGLAGFISEFLIFIGSFQIYPWITSLALIGVIVTAAFFLWTIQRMFLGPLNDQWKSIKDMDLREIWTLAPLLIAMLFIGIYPKPVIDLMNMTLMHLVR